MIDQVTEKLNLLRLKTCAENLDQVMEIAKQKTWSILQTIDHLLDLELEAREKRRIALCFKQSRLLEKPTIDQFNFDYHGSRKKHKTLILHLMSLAFIKQKKDIILIGNPGVGKTFLAKCIAYAATQAGIKVLFTTAMDMINHLISAEADHSLLKKLHYYQSQDLLVCDEIGYLPLGSQGSNLFFQVISSRHDQKSTVITTNLPFADWGKIFDSTTVATAIARTEVAFGNVAVGGTSSPLKVPLNNSDVPLSITSITAVGEFSQTNNCGTSVAANTSCEISVSFSPATTGLLSGSIEIISNAAGSPHTISLSGIGDALLDVTVPEDAVLDPFLGSGTALLAAERTRRRCFGIEIEPAYVDVAIRRWQEMTGGQAILAHTGQKFDEIRDNRYIKTLEVTGNGVLFTGVTLAIGVATWMLSPLKFQADMGLLLAFLFLMNMIGALVLLPALAHFLFDSSKRHQA